MAGERIGEFEELVLLAVCIHQGRAYGVLVKETIEAHTTGRLVTIGAVHATLYRLQDKGLVVSVLGQPTTIRQGRRKRLFSVTAAGLAALTAARAQREAMWQLAPQLNPKEMGR